MPLTGRIDLGDPIPYPMPDGIMFLIAEDGTHHVLARTSGDPFIYIACAETLTDGGSQVSSTNLRDHIASELGESDDIPAGGSGVVTPQMRVGAPGTSKFFGLAQNFSTPENSYQILVIRYVLNAEGNIGIDGKCRYLTSSAGVMSGTYGGALGQTVIGDAVYFVTSFGNGFEGFSAKLATLPVTDDEIILTSNSWASKKFDLPGNFAGQDWWDNSSPRDAKNWATLFAVDGDHVGIMAYRTTFEGESASKLFMTTVDITVAPGTNDGQNDISSLFSLPFDDEGFDFAGDPSADPEDFYTNPSVNVLPDGRLEFIFSRGASDNLGWVGFRRFVCNPDLSGMVTFDLVWFDLGSALGVTGYEAIHARREGDDLIFMIRENQALTFGFQEVEPPGPCPPCEEDFEPCGDTVEAACVAEWPFSELQPRSVGVFLIPATMGGGKSLADGQEQATATANGFWRFRYEGIRVHNADHVRRWHELEALLDGRGGVICVHAYDGKRAPWLTVGSPIVITASGSFAAGSRTGAIKVTTGGVPRAGMFWSYNDRLYMLATVGAPSGSPPIYPVTVLPNIRAAIPDNSALEFQRPTCRSRLATDDAMTLPLHLLQHASQDVDFEEDI